MSTTVTMVHPTTLMVNRRQSLVESSLPSIGIVLVAHHTHTLVMVLSVFWFLHDTNIKIQKKYQSHNFTQNKGYYSQVYDKLNIWTLLCIKLLCISSLETKYKNTSLYEII